MERLSVSQARKCTFPHVFFILSVVFLSQDFIAVYICPQVSFFLFIVFVVYTMLPFSMRDAIIASVLTSASHTLVLSICLSTTADHMEPVVWQVTHNPPQLSN